MVNEDLKPGRRVRVIQTIDRRAGDWRTAVVGVIQALEEQKTGSWYAHSKDDRFWLRRIHLKRDDGEITSLIVDQYTEIEPLDEAPGPS